MRYAVCGYGYAVTAIRLRLCGYGYTVCGYGYAVTAMSFNPTAIKDEKNLPTQKGKGNENGTVDSGNESAHNNCEGVKRCRCR